MAFIIYARMKRVGKQRQAELPPVPFELERRPDTVRELLVSLVQLLVLEYNGRREEGQILKCLTKEEIAGQVTAGKVSFGVHGGNEAKLEASVENALQCFEDGIYRVFAGEKELTGLDQRIPWADEDGKDGLVFTFIRLTMLAGL